MRLISLGFPRSGNNFVRYLIEWFSSIKTVPFPSESPDVMKKFFGDSSFTYKDGICYVTHLHSFKRDRIRRLINNSNLIFVLRDFKECVPRHYKKLIRGLDRADKLRRVIGADRRPPFSIKGIRNCDVSFGGGGTYINHLYVFDMWEKPKVLLRYENLIHPEKILLELNALCDFLGVSDKEEAINKFMRRLEFHKSESLKFYTRFDKGRSVTRGRQHKYHAACLDSSDWIAICQEMESNHYDLVNKYLIPYMVSSNAES